VRAEHDAKVRRLRSLAKKRRDARLVRDLPELGDAWHTASARRPEHAHQESLRRSASDDVGEEERATALGVAGRHVEHDLVVPHARDLVRMDAERRQRLVRPRVHLHLAREPTTLWTSSVPSASRWITSSS